MKHGDLSYPSYQSACVCRISNYPGERNERNSITNRLQAVGEQDFARCMVRGNLHVQGFARVSQILTHEHSSLLANEKGSRVSESLVNASFIAFGTATYVLQPTLSGQILRSATLRPSTPCTFRRSSNTPCLTILFPSFGAMEQVPSECQVVST